MPRVKIIPDKNHEFQGDENFYMSYKYISREWQLQGYRCVKCNLIIKNVNTTKNHLNSCKRNVEKKYNQTPDPDLIVTTDGRPWKPYDFNQN